MYWKVSEDSIHDVIWERAPKLLIHGVILVVSAVGLPFYTGAYVALFPDFEIGSVTESRIFVVETGFSHIPIAV